ncbi:unnamed protein product [Adineta ricciae]|uniref:N-acetyltransferase domain-containing protein n=1 Tax=Adineta ricciae TaxID=249248 RepID=A0A814MCU4_ADIRI|nr:unnamed protein product [Adineta ricciae]CAF1303220.1 unnamed protein product [Adineta ricciae]
MLNSDVSSIIYRSVAKHEENQALEIWCSIFNNPVDLEERLILESSEDGRQYVCAGITNVATRDEYRRRGLSRHLLQMTIDKLDQSNEFDLSMLGTGKVNHYERFRWEQVTQPIRVIIDWQIHASSHENIQWRPVSDLSYEDIELLCKMHSSHRRIYQMRRSPCSIFYHWVKRRWEKSAAIVYLDEDKGYVVIGNPENEEDVGVLEWRASNFDHEQKLLSLAVNEIRQRYGLTKRIQLFTLPQYMTIEQLTNWAGPVQVGTNYDIMMRNIRLPPGIYEQIKNSFSNGHAVFWSGDYF